MHGLAAFMHHAVRPRGVHAACMSGGDRGVGRGAGVFCGGGAVPFMGRSTA
uniref:Uncharacterized protein n=1 Tax=Setaria viridis TaxID=4556 RepID=A0A4U6V9G8_SETVI|nr:hypothetical protein SEVIR_3G047566v2 [Setaria viridis]